VKNQEKLSAISHQLSERRKGRKAEGRMIGKRAIGRRMEFSPPTNGLLAEKTPSSGN